MEEDAIAQGTIFRFPAKWPYEEMVDLMLLNLPEEGTEHSLVVTSGLKAGRLLVRLPLEAELQGPIAVSRKWLIENWAKWIYPDCEAEEVMCTRHYPVPKRPVLTSAPPLP
ncbi:hypothetical protein NCCP691_23530 [Noviherbaspirillum aridicola]|uniref:Immunity protein 45 domain-containing protein n=2 Tax=Noviherbaspirillum aridicola TaxID=2849687 RepID=A0ABQ4Q6J3_9BURK|nr:hypothetical protein NCCP691_23530 [Noviherbaspirillum aridicola]